MSRRKKKRSIHGISQAHQHQRPIRAEDHPFCGYFGPEGQTCAETTNLVQVLFIKGTSNAPNVVWMACPKHHEELVQLAQTFRQYLQHTPEILTLNYHEMKRQILVMTKKKQYD